MKEQTFQAYLLSKGVEGGNNDMKTQFINQIEERLKEKAPLWSLKDLNSSSSQSLVNDMIDRGENTIENLQTLLIYARFINNDDLYLVILQHLDGFESMNNLHSKLGDSVGEDLRDIIFEEMPLPPLGLSPREKSIYTYRIMNRLEEIFEKDTCRNFLKDCLRDLPDSMYQKNLQIFHNDCKEKFDCYLVKKGENFIKTLKHHQQENQLFFGQEITDDVIAFVESNKEIGQGVRAGNIIYETKIPYNTTAYLNESDPLMKRYQYCHCPWVRESIRNGSLLVSSTFCQCSAGFHKKPYELIFGQTLQAEVLESVLKGDMVCRFAIYLPENFRE